MAPPRPKAWNEQQSQLHEALNNPDQHQEAIQLFLVQHAMVHSGKISGDELWSFAESTFCFNFPYDGYVPESLLQTKLYIPPLRPNLMSRPNLIKRLNQRPQPGQKFTLISAPAGFGKTTLVIGTTRPEWKPKVLLANMNLEQMPLVGLAPLAVAAAALLVTAMVYFQRSRLHLD
ncbi:MAG TPA: hypothetical protein VLE70_16375 [Anaerolineae bacterium]|jgi:LuxR family maltose regulon positive regulatory protein|nr:hypothetical protein [Anaerolineae bacterium]